MSTILVATTLNNMTNSRRCTVFSLGSSKVDQKTILYQKRAEFLKTSEAHRMKTVYPREFIILLKVVHIVVSDNFYFDQNTVRSKLCKI